jgi:hypothetical protein
MFSIGQKGDTDNDKKKQNLQQQADDRLEKTLGLKDDKRDVKREREQFSVSLRK